MSTAPTTEQPKAPAKRFTLIFWIADRLDDSAAFSIRGESKRDVLTELQRLGASRTSEGGYLSGGGSHWAAPRRIEISYSTPFDLVRQVTDGGF